MPGRRASLASQRFISTRAAGANIPLVAAISAPSAKAVSLTQEAGITLVDFARGVAMTVYHAGAAILQA